MSLLLPEVLETIRNNTAEVIRVGDIHVRVDKNGTVEERPINITEIMQLFRELRTNCSVVSLNLASVELDDDATRKLCILLTTQLPNLTSINLTNTRIAATQVANLKGALRRKASLQEISGIEEKTSTQIQIAAAEAAEAARRQAEIAAKEAKEQANRDSELLANKISAQVLQQMPKTITDAVEQALKKSEDKYQIIIQSLSEITDLLTRQKGHATVVEKLEEIKRTLSTNHTEVADDLHVIQELSMKQLDAQEHRSHASVVVVQQRSAIHSPSALFSPSASSACPAPSSSSVHQASHIYQTTPPIIPSSLK